MPDDWKQGYLVKLAMKGDLFLCQNYRGFMLQPTISKIFNRIILERMKNAEDAKLRDNQARFRIRSSHVPTKLPRCASLLNSRWSGLAHCWLCLYTLKRNLTALTNSAYGV